MVQAIPNTKRVMARGVKGFREDITPEFQRVADVIGGILLRHADENGLIPIEAEQRVVQAAGDAVLRLFVDSTESAFAADGLTAVSPYAQVLNKWYVYVVIAQVMAQRAWMEKYVPADVLGWLEGVMSRRVPVKETTPPQPSPQRQGGSKNIIIREGENPFLRRPGESDTVYKARLDRLRIFEPNPLAEYEPMHTWVDKNGYLLSKRIWQNGRETRDKLDMMLRDAIQEGISAVDIAKQAEKWLLPGLEGWRTKKPYGRDGSYPAMRLARTEIAFANNQAAYIAASLNPYVGGIDIARSLNGDPTCMPCPEFATIDIKGDRVRDPYPVNSAVPMPPFHPHCVTPGQLVETKRGAIPIEQIVSDDYVLTHIGHYQRVTAAWCREYSGLVHEIVTDSNRFELTPEHPVLTSAGWLDTHIVQPGQQILNTSVSVGNNFCVRVPEGEPSKTGQFCIPNSIFRRIMPVCAITFNRHLTRNNGKIQRISPYVIFTHEDDLMAVKCIHHGLFDGIGDIFPFESEQSLTANDKTGVDTLFDCRDFASNFGPFSGIVVASNIQFLVDLLKCFAGDLGPGAIITCPFGFHAFTFGVCMQSEIMQDLTEHSESQTQLFTNRRVSETLPEIQILDHVINGALKLCFDTYYMPVSRRCFVAFPATKPYAWTATINTGGGFGHDNLSSLSLEDRVGAASRYAVVSEVANPAQAHLYYSTVQRIQTRYYSGLVYNMEVETDNSYTVNGAVVHNCMCRVESVVADDADAVTAQLRAAMEDARAQYLEPYLTPAQADTFIEQLVGRALMDLVAQVLQLPLF